MEIVDRLSGGVLDTQLKGSDILFAARADTHFQYQNPVSRTDNYFEAQLAKVDWINQYLEDHGIPYLLDAGDLFHSSRPDKILDMLPEIAPRMSKWISIYGNHDLPWGSPKYIKKSAYYSLALMTEGVNIGLVEHGGSMVPVHEYAYENLVVAKYNYGTPIHEYSSTVHDVIVKDQRAGKTTVALIHTYVWNNSPPVFDKQGLTTHSGLQLLKDFPEYDVIVSGDNHESFYIEYEGRVLINPGSLMRMTAEQQNYQPKLYLYTRDRQVLTVDIPCAPDVVTRTHIETKESREFAKEAMQVYMDLCKQSAEFTYDFNASLMQRIQSMETQGMDTDILRSVYEVLVSGDSALTTG